MAACEFLLHGVGLAGAELGAYRRETRAVATLAGKDGGRDCHGTESAMARRSRMLQGAQGIILKLEEIVAAGPGLKRTVVFCPETRAGEAQAALLRSGLPTLPRRVAAGDPWGRAEALRGLEEGIYDAAVTSDDPGEWAGSPGAGNLVLLAGGCGGMRGSLARGVGPRFPEGGDAGGVASVHLVYVVPQASVPRQGASRRPSL